MGNMVALRNALGGSVLCAFNVSREEVFNSGVFDVEEVETEIDGVDVLKVRGMVEKPVVEDAPSTLVVTGRYFLDRGIFGALRRIKPGNGGELQLADAIELMISAGHPVYLVGGA